MIALRWDQVNAWRLKQQHLSERADRQHMLEVAKALNGLQAQVMSAAELQLWARVENLTPADVQDALWRERTLVKTWLWRGTLHLAAASQFPLYIGGLSTLRHFERPSWQKYFGVSLAELQAMMEGIRQVLSDSGMKREQLAQALAEYTGIPQLQEHLMSGWGSLLKPAAFQGLLCFGPSEGQNVTFVQPRHWLGDHLSPVESGLALNKIARHFLNAYGPARMDEFVRWFGLEAAAAKKIFRALGDEIVEVDVQGWKAWMLRAAVEAMDGLEASSPVRLLPLFDPYTLAVAKHAQYLFPEAHKGRVYRPQGWISAVVLVGGRIGGVWEYEKQRSKVNVSVEMFAPVDDAVKQGIAVEVKRLGDFLASEVDLTFV